MNTKEDTMLCNLWRLLTPCVLALFLLCTLPRVASAGVCSPSATTLCLDGDRYQVTSDWTAPGGSSGSGRVFPAGTESTGFMTLDDPNTVDLMATVVDGCSINNNSWVFLVDLSTLGSLVTATDLQGGSVQTYNFNQGSIHQPVADTEALPCPTRLTTPVPAGAPSLSRGVTSTTSLHNRRFRVSMTWDSGMASGQGIPIELTDSSVAFWYFSPDNPERLLKIEPGTLSVNGTGFYTLTSGSPSNIRQTVTIVDTCTGNTRVFDQAPGLTLTFFENELASFQCASEFFDATFESGDFSGWSTVLP